MRLSNYSAFSKNYFSNPKNEEVFKRVCRKCYIPANSLMLDLINKYNGQFRFSFSITGTFIEQAKMFNPEVIESFRELVKTGCVDLLDETYYHSLAFLISEKEFTEQIRMHRRLMKKEFNYSPSVFRNTEAMYSNKVAEIAKQMGYKAVVAEGWEKYLGWRSPNYVYCAPSGINLLLRNYKLSDDIGFRFSARSWNEFPLTADKYASWLSTCPGEIVNLFIDYETFGEHQWQETGIFEFLRHLPAEVLKYQHMSFAKLNETALETPVAELSMPDVISWADIDRDLSAWLGNNIQQKAFEFLKSFDGKLKGKALELWRKLQTSDHFYYMCTKWFADGDVHKYFNAYDTPYDAYINYVNVLQDLQKSV